MNGALRQSGFFWPPDGASVLEDIAILSVSRIVYQVVSSLMVRCKIKLLFFVDPS